MRPGDTMATVKVHKTYPITDRPDVEVEIDGTWHYGELRQWLRIDTFPAARVRPYPEGSYPTSG